jgi:hypothetical protein
MRAKLAGATTLLTLVAIVASIGLSISLVDRWSRRRAVLTRWPLVNATIQSCAIHRDYPFQRNGGGVVLQIICHVNYEVAGTRHAVRIDSSTRHVGDSGGYLTVDRGSVAWVHPEPVLRAWIASHPAGSRVALRYEPSRPESATFVGLDDIVDVDPVPGTAAGALLFGGLAVLGRSVARRLGRSSQAAP